MFIVAADTGRKAAIPLVHLLCTGANLGATAAGQPAMPPVPQLRADQTYKRLVDQILLLERKVKPFLIREVFIRWYEFIHLGMPLRYRARKPAGL